MPLPVFSRAKPVRQLVYETLRQAICDGGFAPGTRLVEEELAEQLQVSRTPIREALRRLESEGLIAHAHCKGATVLGFSRDDVIELYSIREALEALAIHYTIQHITREEINQLKAIVDKMRSNLHSRDVSAHFEWNQKFNDLLIDTCKMPRLTRLINTYREHLHHFRHAAMGKHEGRMLEAFREHEQILHAVMAKDSVKAESLVRQHLQAAKRAYTSGNGAAERSGARSRTPGAAPDTPAPRVLRGGGATGSIPTGGRRVQSGPVGGRSFVVVEVRFAPGEAGRRPKTGCVQRARS